MSPLKRAAGYERGCARERFIGLLAQSGFQLRRNGVMTEAELKKIRAALAALKLDLPELNFIQKDSLSNVENVTIHQVDRTPVVFDPDLGEGQPQEFCFASRGLDIAGKAVTDRNGRHRWELKNYICEAPRVSISEPVAFVATARSRVPVVMTTETVATGTTLVIEVFSWDMSGAAAANVRFSWRCWAESPHIIE
jgi:hypothetical protein